MESLKVKDVMSAPVVTARPETALSDIIRMMMEGPYSGLPVINGGNELIGIVTEMDVLKALEGGDAVICSDIMTRNPVTIDAGAPLFDAVNLLLKHNIIRLPVTDGGRLSGVVARRDILMAFADRTGEDRDKDLPFILETAKALLSAKSQRDVLRILVHKMGKYFEARRCSVIRVDEGRKVATVLSTYEDPYISNLDIDLRKYPEITEVYRTGHPVVLQDAVEAPLMKAVRHSLAGIDLKSILVFPVFSKDKVVGTLHLRTQSRRQLSGKEIRVAEVLSVIAADAIKAVIKEERLREMYKAAEKKVVIDDLTGLYNRRFLNIRLEEEFNMSQRHGLPLSCIMFDIDHFKSINDTLGHREGDRVLRRFSACLREKVRISDIISRYGGEEFVLLLPVTDASGAMREAVRMKSCLDSLDFGPRLVAVTASIGIASYPYPGVRTHEDLIRNADEAMYEAKRKGRDRIETFDEALSRSHMTAG